MKHPNNPYYMVPSIEPRYPFEQSFALEHPSSILNTFTGILFSTHVLFIHEIRLDKLNLPVFI